jgi:hypothetical protein
MNNELDPAIFIAVFDGKIVTVIPTIKLDARNDEIRYLNLFGF